MVGCEGVLSVWKSEVIQCPRSHGVGVAVIDWALCAGAFDSTVFHFLRKTRCLCASFAFAHDGFLSEWLGVVGAAEFKDHFC